MCDRVLSRWKSLWIPGAMIVRLEVESVVVESSWCSLGEEHSDGL